MPRRAPSFPELAQAAMLQVIGPAYGWSLDTFTRALEAGKPQPAADRHAAQVTQLQAAQQARHTFPLLQFVQEAWSLIEPQPYVHGWHLEAICQHLEAVTETALATDDCPVPPWTASIRNLLINVPPRSSKSLVTSVMWLPWVWLTAPQTRFLFASYSGDLSLRDATYSRTLMSTGWYQSLLPQPAWRFTTDQRVKSFYSNTAMGYRISTSVGGQATGFGGDLRCADDLHSTSEDFSTSRAEIEAAKQFWTMTMSTRQTNAKRSCQVLVGQRVALDDVSGEVLKRQEYTYLKIPMEFEKDHVAPPTPLGWVDPRTEEGALLCPERFGPAEVATYKTALGHRYFSQYQQRPSSEHSSLFPRTRWRFYHVWPPVESLSVIIQSWDMTFGSMKEQGSYVSGHVWGRVGPPDTGNLVLLDRVFERLSFTDSVKEVVRLSEKWPGSYIKLIEQAANGIAIYETLRSKVFGLQLVPVGGRYSSKLARAEAVAHLQEAGRGWLPHPSLAPWVDAFIDNLEGFPGEPTDDTDALSMAWNYLAPRAPIQDAARAEAMKKAEYAAKLQAVLRNQNRRLTGTGV